MSTFFNLDSSLMRGMSKVFDIMVLNIVVLLCCIPIITIGPAMTALYYVTMKMSANEEGYIVKGFFKSFVANLKQSLILWILMILTGITAFMNYFIMSSMESEMIQILGVLIIAIEILCGMAMLYIFPLLARFENTCLGTVKNAVLLSILHFPTTILIAIILIAPSIFFIMFPMFLPMSILFGISGPVYLAAILFNRMFKKLEANMIESKTLTSDEVKEIAELK